MKTINDSHIQMVLQLFPTIHKEAWLVGGCVRDMLMERELHDYDITTDATPYEVMALFRKYGYRVIPSGLKHGTVTVLVQDEPVEITTYRTESAYTDHRSPKAVRFTSDLDEDLKRRDFTMNAIAWHPKRGFHDPYHGQADIARKIIRCVGNASERMQEDALRIFRALRFHCTLHFAIEEETAQAIRTHAHLLSYISRERIREEFNRILLQDYPDTLQLLKDMRVLDAIAAGYTRLMNKEQNNPWHIYDVFTHTDVALNHTAGMALEGKLAIIFHDVGKPACEASDADGISHYNGHAQKSVELAKHWLKELRYDNKTIHRVLRCIAYHDYNLTPKKSTLRRYLSKFDNQLPDALLALDVQLADQLAKNPELAANGVQLIRQCKELLLKMHAEEELLSLQTLAVNGRDMMDCGLRGKQIKTALHMLLDYAMQDPSRNTKEQLLEELKRNAEACTLDSSD